MEKKVNRINVYLSNKDRQRLNELKYKYHVSYSTIADVITEICINEIPMKEVKIYIYNDTNKYKTSIKPKNAGKYENRTQIYTNMIKVFVRGDLIKYVKEEKALKLEMAVIHRLETTQDDNWDGNQFNRNMVRWLKHNPNYARKILEGEK